jgi:hypothetical protein
MVALPRRCQDTIPMRSSRWVYTSYNRTEYSVQMNDNRNGSLAAPYWCTLWNCISPVAPSPALQATVHPVAHTYIRTYIHTYSTGIPCESLEVETLSDTVTDQDPSPDECPGKIGTGPEKL